MVGEGRDIRGRLAEGVKHLTLAAKLPAVGAEAVAGQRGWEPGNDIAELNATWATEKLPDPVTVYHRVSRAFLEGVGDLLSGLTLALQGGQPLLVSIASLARPVHEYSSRAAFLTDPKVAVNDRLARVAIMINEGFDNAGGKNPKAHDQVKATASPFYDWYNTRGPDLTDRVKKFSKYLRSDAVFAETLGTAYQEPVYNDLSNFAHGNGPAVLALYDAALRPDVDGPAWSAVNSLGRVFYALDCALHATRKVNHFTDPNDQRAVSAILPYLAELEELGAVRPDALLAIADTQRLFAQSHWKHCCALLVEARDAEK